MAKGKFKRRNAGSQFKRGHKKNPPYRTYLAPSAVCSDSSIFNSTLNSSNCDYQIPDLRPRLNLKEQNMTEPLGNRVFNLNQLLKMMNSVYEHHGTTCKNFNISLKNEIKYGLGSKFQFACKSCDYVSENMDSFMMCRDSKKIAINRMLASSLQDMAIGIEKAILLFASLDIPPPSRTTMQTIMNQASLNTIQLNDRDMAEKRQFVIRHNTEQGQGNPNHFNLSFDARYNATRMVSSYKPGQAASQAYGVAIENHTSFKYIVGLAVQNKLCWMGAYLRNKGFDTNCPGGHPECTANIPYMQPHSERAMAYDIAEQLSKEDLIIRSFTTDGDTKSHLGLKDFYDKLGNVWSGDSQLRQADPNHLGSSQVRKVRSANWSQTLFEGKKHSRAVTQQAISAFAKDIKARCGAIIQKLRTVGNGNLVEHIDRLPSIRAATLNCYAGNCSFCPHDSLVCSGTGGIGDWWYHSTFLPTHGIHHLKLTQNDRELLSTILEIRLSEYAVRSVSSDTSTQKCEAFNRAVLSTLPKDVNLSRNFAGKLASKTLQLNNSIQESVEKKVSSITGNNLSPSASIYLKSISKRSQQHKKYQKTVLFKTRRKKNRAKLEHSYHQARNTTQCNDEYVKGQMTDAGPGK